MAAFDTILGSASDLLQLIVTMTINLDQVLEI